MQCAKDLPRISPAMVSATILIIWILGNPGSATAAGMDEFLKNVLTWTQEERPRLMISRGAILAWIKDPTDFNSANPADYYWSSNSKVVVSPGTPVMRFPPRLNKERQLEYPGRLADSQYQLALTKDGFWGVIDTTQSNSFLDEADVLKIASVEPADSTDSQFGIFVGSAHQIYDTPSVWLSRGEIFHIVRSTPDFIDIDFNSDVANMKAKLADMGAAQSGVTTPSTFKLEFTAKFVDFRITGKLVPSASVRDWQTGRGNYTDIFNGAFASLWIPREAELQQGCSETIIKTKGEAEAKITGETSASVSAQILAWLQAKLSLSASAKGEVSKTIEQTVSQKTTARETLRLVNYKDPVNPETVFGVGTAQTCRDPLWRTVVVRTRDDARFIHSTFYSLSQSAPPISSSEDPIQKSLGSLAPGGNPWNIHDGTFRIRCFSQHLALENLAREQMEDSETPFYKVRAAIALTARLPAMTSSTVLFRFIGSDSDCSSSAN
jgi:hypothetical protein